MQFNIASKNITNMLRSTAHYINALRALTGNDLSNT